VNEMYVTHIQTDRHIGMSQTGEMYWTTFIERRSIPFDQDRRKKIFKFIFVPSE